MFYTVHYWIYIFTIGIRACLFCLWAAYWKFLNFVCANFFFEIDRLSFTNTMFWNALNVFKLYTFRLKFCLMEEPYCSKLGFLLIFRVHDSSLFLAKLMTWIFCKLREEKTPIKKMTNNITTTRRVRVTGLMTCL